MLIMIVITCDKAICSILLWFILYDHSVVHGSPTSKFGVTCMMYIESRDEMYMWIHVQMTNFLMHTVITHTIYKLQDNYTLYITENC